MTKQMIKSDPADLTFFSNLFASIAAEMGVTLARTAYSPNIKERRDFSCAVFDGSGELVAQAAHIPVHLGAMPMSVRAALDRFGEISPGDVIILNDPFAGGTHLPDITLVTPVFDRTEGKPFAFLATRAHHADVGGMSPGSLPVSRSIFQEGLRLPPLKLHEGGKPNQAVLDILHANVRTPQERAGDLRAQLAAHRVGEGRLREIIDKYGVATLSRHMRDLLRYGEQLMRSVIEAVPDGRYTFEDWLDDDGINPQPIKIRVAITIDGSAAMVDFDGSDPSCKGNLNSVEPVTSSAVYYCFLGLLVTPSATKSTMPAEPPLNAGCFAPINIIAPEGTIVNVRPPHAVAGGNVETSQRIVDAVLGALAGALPDVIPAASQGTMNNLTLGGHDPRRGQPFAYYETMAGGAGASPHAHGADGVQVHMTNTLNTPVEALEFAYPLRIERYEIADGTGGKGEWDGGSGLRRDVRLLCNARGALLSERRARSPYGLQGGEPGQAGVNRLIRGDEEIELGGKAQLELNAGDVISLRTPGGGGWGKPGAVEAEP